MAPYAEEVHLRDELHAVPRHSAIDPVLELDVCVVDGVIWLPNEEVTDIGKESVSRLFEFVGRRPIVFSLGPLRVLSAALGRRGGGSHRGRHCQSLCVETVIPDVRYDCH